MGLRFITLFGIVASIVTGIAVGILGHRHWSGGETAARQADVIEQAAEYIRTSYVEDVAEGQLISDALKGMLEGLDDYSRFLDADAYKRLRADTAGRFGGVGVEIGLVGGYFIVLEVLEDSPAARAGLAVGDRLIAVDNDSLKGGKLHGVIELLRGPGNTEVQLGLVRSGSRFDVTLTRTRLESASVRTRWLEPGFVYARVGRFQRRTGNDFADAVVALREEREIDGLVLDLRNNPGGVLGASIDVADALLPRGTLICTEGRPTSGRLEHRALVGDLLRGVPAAVLINEGSASGSEIVAGALQDHGRAAIIGAKSYGKGTVQSLLPLAGNRALKLTTGYYYRPSGNSIHARGVVPDVQVDSPDLDVLLARALQVLKAESVAAR